MLLNLPVQSVRNMTAMSCKQWRLIEQSMRHTSAVTANLQATVESTEKNTKHVVHVAHVPTCTCTSDNEWTTAAALQPNRMLFKKHRLRQRPPGYRGRRQPGQRRYDNTICCNFPLKVLSLIIHHLFVFIAP